MVVDRLQATGITVLRFALPLSGMCVCVRVLFQLIGNIFYARKTPKIRIRRSLQMCKILFTRALHIKLLPRFLSSIQGLYMNSHY